MNSITLTPTENTEDRHLVCSRWLAFRHGHQKTQRPSTRRSYTRTHAPTRTSDQQRGNTKARPDRERHWLLHRALGRHTNRDRNAAHGRARDAYAMPSCLWRTLIAVVGADHAACVAAWICHTFRGRYPRPAGDPRAQESGDDGDVSAPGTASCGESIGEFDGGGGVVMRILDRRGSRVGVRRMEVAMDADC